MRFMYRDEQPSRGAQGDSGALSRALELALEGIGTPHADGAVGRVALAAGATGRVRDVARGLDDEGLVARVRSLTPAAVRRAAQAGARVLARIGDDWLVVTGGRATLVSAGSEWGVSTSPRALARTGLGEDVESILVEPRLALARLSATHSGSTSPWTRLRAFAGLEGRELASLIVYAIVIGGLSLAVPIAAQVLVNTIAFGSLLQPLFVLTGLLLAVLVFAGLVQVIQWYAVEVLQRRIFVRVAEDLVRRVVALSAQVHDRFDARELSNRFFEVVSLQKTVSRLLLDGLGLALQTLVGLLLLAFYHPVLLAFDLVLVLALGVVIAFGLRAVPTAIAESRAKYRVAAWLETVAAGRTQFKRGAAATFAAMRADVLTRAYLGARRRHYARVLSQLVGGVGVQIFAMVALLGLGGWLVIRGELTLGQLVAAELVVGVIGVGFAKVGKHLEAVYDLLASLDKLGRVLDLPLDPVRHPRPRREQLSLHLDAVAVVPGIAPVSAVVDHASRALLEGPAASGKSALLETLAGLREPRAGALSIPDVDDVAGYLRQRALLLQADDLLSEGTVLDNLRVVDPGLDEERAWEALAAVGLRASVGALEQGLHTPVFAGKGPLSGSERARLGLARALVASPELLLVDGTLDHLGLEGSARDQVLDTISGADAPWALVVVSGDPSVRERCRSSIGTAREEAR